jgi:signal transduction histidine kinase
MVATLVALFGTVGYFFLVDGLSRNTINPWDMRMADITDQPDGSGKVTGFISVTGQMGADKSAMVMQVPVSRLIENASEDGTIEIRTFGGQPIIVDKALLTGSGAPSNAQMWAYVFVSLSDQTKRNLVVAAQSQSGLASTLGLFRRTLLISAAVTLFVAAVLGFFLVRRMLRPLRAITQAAQGIEGHDPSAPLGTGLSGRIEVHRDDEVGELASTLNRMFDRVETAFDTERQVASDLSHELRTPLAVMQSEATQALRKERGDQAYHRALETVSREISHVSSVADRLLFLARSEHGGELAQTPVNLKDLMTEIGWDAEVLCEEKGIIFQSDVSGLSKASDSFVITGDKTRLRELFLNLVNNAVRYTPAGGKISLSVGRQDGYIRASVSDTGIGIAEKHLPHIFKRFYRVDNGNSPDDDGAGLGLAICQRIAQLHGGKIEVHSKVGEGSTFTVFLPGIANSSR